MKFLLLFLPFALLAQTPAQDLAARVSAAHTANAEKVRSYAFRQYHVQTRKTREGRETDRTTKTWEVIGLEGAPYRKLIERDDKPLPPKEAAKEDQKMKAEGAARRKAPRRFLSTSYSFNLPVRSLAKIYNLTAGPEEQFAGRPMHTLTGLPKNSAFTDVNEREASNYNVKVWVDDATGFPAVTELEVIGEKSKLRKGSRVRLEYFLNPEGVWLSRTNSVDFIMKVGPLGFRGLAVDTFSDFKRFQVESGIVAEPPY